MISTIIPFKNEAESLRVLLPQVHAQLAALGEPYEIILINNGSTDNWQTSVEKAPNVHIINLKTADKGRALRAGVEEAAGDILLFMDADLEDNPADIPLFYAKIKEGYDLVNGWRRNRRHEWHRVLPSFFGNKILLNKILGSKFKDINCGFKMFRKSCLDNVVLYGDNFRFLPLVIEKLGYRTGEVVVSHAKRKYGRSKYGFFNRLTVFADILTAYFIFRFAQKPLHFFGFVGIVLFVPGAIVTLVLAIERIFFGVELYKRPLLLAGVLLIIVGLQIIMTGIIGELIVYLSKKTEKIIKE